MAKCQLQPIQCYPFSLQAEESFMHLNYTCLIAESTAKQLQIGSHAFRYLRSANLKRLVLLIIDDSLGESETIVIFAPLTVLRWFQEEEVAVYRQPIRLVNPVLPELQSIKQVNVYFNNNFVVDQALIQFLSSSDFVCQTGQYFIDCLWLKDSLSQIKSLKERLFYQRLINDCGVQKTNYLRIFIEVSDRQQIGLFRKGETKLTIKKQALHPFNIYTTIQLTSLQEYIFDQSTYQQALKELKSNAKNEIIFIETNKDIGLQKCLHAFSQQQLQVDFRCIDCELISSTKQFWSELQLMSTMGDAVILIKNIAWLEQLYQTQQILNFELKHILEKIQKSYKEIVNQSPRKHYLLVEHIGENQVSHSIQNAKTISLKIDRPQKILIFTSIFLHYDKSFPYQQQIIQQFHDKFGWEVFLGFMDNSWKYIRNQQKSKVFKKLRELVKQEQVQNLIEVSWDDVGGLQTAKEEIVQTVLLPIKHPQIFDEWIKPRTGLLFFGPPGTGKTLLGKCVAKQCKMNFISVKGPQLLNMYVGQSEKNVRAVFQRARACSPCIIFMDELDALVPKRGNSGDSNQVMDRIVAELLQQMDTASSNQVFIIGATNRPDLLDPSILRPGRFDKQIYLGITQAKQDRIKIIKAQTRHLTLEQNLNWDRILQSIPKNFTGADFYGLTSRAVMAAAERTIEQYQKGMIRQKICLSEQDFLAAIPGIKPSVTQADLSRYESLRKIYS